MSKSQPPEPSDYGNPFDKNGNPKLTSVIRREANARNRANRKRLLWLCSHFGLKLIFIAAMMFVGFVGAACCTGFLLGDDRAICVKRAIGAVQGMGFGVGIALLWFLRLQPRDDGRPLKAMTAVNWILIFFLIVVCKGGTVGLAVVALSGGGSPPGHSIVCIFSSIAAAVAMMISAVEVCGIKRTCSELDAGPTTAPKEASPKPPEPPPEPAMWNT